MKKLTVIGILLLWSWGASAQKTLQKGLNNLQENSFNEDWKFSKGTQEKGMDPTLDVSKWRSLNLPHDWAIEGPFDVKYNARAGGLPFHGEAWYRKSFVVPKELEGKKAFIHFEGVMNNSEIFLNGKKIGERPYGYIGFQLDMTSQLKFGEENIIAVKCAPEDLSSRWYPGAGIYRDVWVEYKAPVHIAFNGTFITTPDVRGNRAMIEMETEVVNTEKTTKIVQLETVIYSPEGEEVTRNSKEVKVAGNTEIEIRHNFFIDDAQLWDLDSPSLYKIVSRVLDEKQILDIKQSKFGIRTIDYGPQKGFVLNNKRVRLQGVCLHHDQGPLGAAVNRRAKQRQLEVMKEMGVNAIRTSHNPPSKALLELCDEMGLLVIDEAFDMWRIPKVENGYAKFYDEWSERDLRDMIRRDRNHPSIIMWSIGNEILEQSKKDGWKETRRLARITKDEDLSRPVTAGFNYYPASVINKLAHEVDIPGFNYKPMKYKEIIEQHPDWTIYGSETSSCTSSRGVYHFPIETYKKHPSQQVTSYDLIGPIWSSPPDLDFDMLAENPNVLGEFVWTGFDYLGEPTPYGGRDNSTNGYWNDDWPVHSSYFGIADICGFPKDRYYLYQSQWTKEPMVHVLPHWNWEGKEGDVIPVHAFTNCEEVELIVNGKSYGKKVKGVDLTEIPMIHKFWDKSKPYMSKYRLSWEVPYHAGEIKVIAYTDGKVMTEKVIKTAGKPHHIELKADRSLIANDSKDISYVTVNVVDKNGNLCYTAGNDISFKIKGQGLMAGVGNGDASSLTSLQGNKMEVFSGKALAIVKAQKNAEGSFILKASSPGLKSAEIEIKLNAPSL